VQIARPSKKIAREITDSALMAQIDERVNITIDIFGHDYLAVEPAKSAKAYIINI